MGLNTSDIVLLKRSRLVRIAENFMMMQTQQEIFNQGLELEAHKHGLSVSEQVDLIRLRPAAPVAPYTPPETAVFWTVETKRTAFGTGCLTLIISAAQGALNTVAPWVFGGFVVAFGVPWLLRGFIGGLRECFTWESGGNNGQGASSGPGGGQQWEEFYQKQEQGYRRKV